MRKIPYKVRLWLSIGLILWDLVAVIAAIVYYAFTSWLWLLITVISVAFLLFILAIILFPRFKDDGTTTVEPKTKAEKPRRHRPKKYKKKFISNAEWKELDEEDEESMYINED